MNIFEELSEALYQGRSNHKCIEAIVAGPAKRIEIIKDPRTNVVNNLVRWQGLPVILRKLPGFAVGELCSECNGHGQVYAPMHASLEEGFSPDAVVKTKVYRDEQGKVREFIERELMPCLHCNEEGVRRF